MKKIFSVIAVIFMAAINVCAQPDQGNFYLTSKIGATYGKFTKDFCFGDNNNYYSYYYGYGSNFPNTFKSKPKVDLCTEFDLQYQYKPNFGVTMGLGLQSQTNTIIAKDFSCYYGKFTDNVKLNLVHLIIPITANVYIFKGLALNVGLQPQFLIRNIWTSSFDYADDQKAESEDIEGSIDNLQKFTMSLPVGASYEYNNIIVDFRYTIGLSNISGAANNSEIRNNVLLLTVGYKCKL